MESGGFFFQGGCYLLLWTICVLVFAKNQSRNIRQTVLLLGGFGLYLTWEPWFAVVLATSIGANFLFGNWLRRNPHWLPLSAGILFNLILLGAFRYLPELAVHLSKGSLHGFAKLALPLGISFWTFQAMSYLFDVYRDEELDPSLVEFALYMVFFPVTISGPVCRMPEMLLQFRSVEKTRPGDIAEGLRRIATGVFMMQLARLLGQGILAGDGIASGFDHAAQWGGPDVWCLSFGYGLQLFFDFAGYTHIAVGAAKALGITIPENFARPFSSGNPSVFWTRWHMSLSFWIRDYVFFPLATARREIWWRNLALIISMAVFGMWHGASLLFLIWGCYHGVLLVLHRLIQQWAPQHEAQAPSGLRASLGWAATAAFISLGWIFFRSGSLAQAGQMLAAIVSPASYTAHFLSLNLYLLVGVLAFGYAIVLRISDAVDRQLQAETSGAASQTTFLALLVRWRWIWVPSLYLLALLFVFLITHGQEMSAGQLMYRRF